MSGSTIGIKIADGSYYPVLEEGFTGKKTLTLTTVKDNQSKVQIDLYRGDGGTVDKAQYIGSLIIENIPPAPKGQPDIELLLGVDEAGELSAEASDRSTGESQSFSIGLKTLTAEETYEIPEFEMEGAPKATVVNEPPLAGETYPVGESDRRKERFERRGPNPALIALFIVLGVALIAAIVFFVVKNVRTAVPVETASETEAPAPPAKEEPAPAQAAPAPAEQGKTESGTAMAPAPAAAQPMGGVNYLIKKGDTLWDISSTYYRNPWLYPKLAKANKIKNPDLIFAGTKIYIPEE